MRSWYRIEAKAQEPDVADVYVYSEIGKSFWDDDTVTASKFIAELHALPDAVTTIRLHVNSPGGSVFEAHAIANALRAQRDEKGRTIDVRIDGLAASAATIVTSAGNPIRVADNAMVMIHDPQGIEAGPASAMRKMADALDSIKRSIIAVYRWVSSKTEDELSTMMAETTWMDAAQAVENGFATEIVSGAPVTACLTRDVVAKLGPIPEQFSARVEALVERSDVGQPAPTGPAAASAAEVLRHCREAGCLDLAEGLITAEASLPQVVERIVAVKADRAKARAREEEIRALCVTAQLPELADTYLQGTMPLAAIRDQLTRITAKLQSAEIDGALPPDRGATPQARIDITAVYAARNRLHVAKEH